MSQILPDALARYLAGLNRWPNPEADALERDGRARGLPVVHAETGRLLHLLASAIGARRILEIGAAIGHSTTWLAQALPPDGLLISIERAPDRAAAARANLERAGLSGRATIMIGEAERLIWKVAGPFDLIFQDGDKEQYEPMLDRLVALLRPGGLLVADNALWDGEVVPGFVTEPKRSPGSIAAIAGYNRRITSDDRLRSMILPIGDGVAVSLKREPLS
jgi:caffeoyl-CoA O-methyltransferase